MARPLRIVTCAVAAAMAWCGMAGPAAGQPVVYPRAGTEQGKRLSHEQRQERRFLQDEAAHLRFASEAARLALEKSNHPQVRELAAQITRQHRTAWPAVVRLLHVRGMAPPLAPNEHVKLLKRLGKAGGRQFDRLFLEQVGRRAQAAELRDLERYAMEATDPAIRSWIEARAADLRRSVVLAGRATVLGNR